MLIRKTPTIHEDLRAIGDRRRLNEPVKPFIEHLVIISKARCYLEQ